jgi:hypothetical protein
MNDDLDIPDGFGTGLIKRDFNARPSGYHAHAPTYAEASLIPENEWASRLKDQQDAKASLWDLREDNYDTLKSLNQGRFSLCWAFSTTKAAMYTIIRQGGSPKILSAWFVAGLVKRWQDQGGDGSDSLAEFAKIGAPEMSLCPSYSSQYDNAATRANAALYKVTEWWDGTDNRAQNMKIMISAFLMGLAPVLDFGRLGHSMCGCRLVDLAPTIDCDNSWGDRPDKGAKGTWRLTGSDAIPDNIVVPRVTLA